MRTQRVVARDHLCGLLREARKKAGVRQADLARRLGRPQSYVSKYESGERRLDVIELLAVCSALGLSFVGFARKIDRLISPAIAAEAKVRYRPKPGRAHEPS